MIVFGLTAGHWPRVALLAAAVLWPVALVASDVMVFKIGLVTAAALAIVNTAAGVLVHQGIRLTFRRLLRLPSTS